MFTKIIVKNFCSVMLKKKNCCTNDDLKRKEKKKETQYFKQFLSNYPHFKNSKCVLPMNNPIY